MINDDVKRYVIDSLATTKTSSKFTVKPLNISVYTNLNGP